MHKSAGRPADLAESQGLGASTPTVQSLLHEVSIRAESGSLDDALLLVRKSYEYAANSADTAWILHREGQVLLDLGYRSEAEHAYIKMRALGEEIQDARILGWSNFGLGAVHQTGGESENARSAYRLSLTSLQKAKDFHAIINVMLNWAKLDIEAQQLDEASETLRAAETLLAHNPDPYLRANWRELRGLVNMARKMYRDASEEFKSSLFEARLLDSKRLILRAIRSLGVLAVEENNLASAAKRFRRGLIIAEESCLYMQLIELHRWSAYVESVRGNDDASVVHLQRLVQVSRARGDEVFSSAAAELVSLLVSRESYAAATRFLDSLDLTLFSGLTESKARSLWSDVLAIEIHNLDSGLYALRLAGKALRNLAFCSYLTRASVLRHGAHLLLKRGWPDPAIRFLQMSVRQLQDEGTGKEIAVGMTQAAALLRSEGYFAASVRFFRSAVQEFHKLEDVQNEYRCRNDLANTYVRMSQFAKAEREYIRCKKMGEGLADRAMLAQTALNRGEALSRRQRHSESLVLLREALSLYRELGDLEFQSLASANAGVLLKKMGEIESAKAMFETARELAVTSSYRPALAVAFGGLAEVALESGDFTQAFELFSKAIGLEVEGKDEIHEAESLRGLIEAAAALGRITDVKLSVRRLLQLDRVVSPDVAALVFRRSAMTALGAEHPEIAAALLSASIAAFVHGRRDIEFESEEFLRSLAGQVVDIVVMVAREYSVYLETVLPRVVGGLRSTLGGEESKILEHFINHAWAGAKSWLQEAHRPPGRRPR